MKFEDWYNDENNAKGIKETLENINNTREEIDDIILDMQKSIDKRRKRLEQLKNK